MSAFGCEAELMCSIRALPVETRSGPACVCSCVRSPSWRFPAEAYDLSFHQSGGCWGETQAGGSMLFVRN